MMLPIKQKLQSKRGASMIMAMVFLLFCMLIGGSVYASATTNGSLIENMTDDQQEYYSQRSAMLLMAELLKNEDGKQMQVLVTDIVQQTGEGTVHSVNISCPNLPAEASILQKILLEVVLSCYQQEGVVLNHSYNWTPSLPLASSSGTLYMACDIDLTEYLVVNYKIHTPGSQGNQDYSMDLNFDAEKVHFTMTMDGSVSTGTPKTVTVDDVTTTTTTTLIRWSLPDIQKNPQSAENQTGGN